MLDPQDFFDTGHIHSTRVITEYRTDWPKGRSGMLIYLAEKAYLSLVDFSWRKDDGRYNVIGFHQSEYKELIKPDNVMAKGIPAMMLAMIIECREVSFKYREDILDSCEDEFLAHTRAENARKAIDSYYAIVNDPIADNYRLSTDIVGDWLYALDHEVFFNSCFTDIVLFPLMSIQPVISNLVAGRIETERPTYKNWHDLIKPLPYDKDGDGRCFYTYDESGIEWRHFYVDCGYGQSVFHSQRVDSEEYPSERFAATGLLAFIMNCAFKTCLLNLSDYICFLDKLQVERYLKDGEYYFESKWLFGNDLRFPVKEVFAEYISTFKDNFSQYIEDSPTFGLDVCSDMSLCRQLVKGAVSELESINDYSYWKVLNNQQKFTIGIIFKNFLLCLEEQCPGCCAKENFNLYTDIPKLLDFEHMAIKVPKTEISVYGESKGALIEKQTQSSNSSEQSPEEQLLSYLTVAYKTMRKDDCENMLSVLRDEKWQSPKDQARFALAIYNSGNIIPKKKPNTFKDWYKRYCEMFGLTPNDNYKESKLTSNEATRQIELYL